MLRKLILAAGGSTPAGIAGQVRPRRLTASPAESEHPVAEINYYFLLFNSNKLYEKSLLKKIVIFDEALSFNKNSFVLFFFLKEKKDSVFHTYE
jgi:hypothetical protein